MAKGITNLVPYKGFLQEALPLVKNVFTDGVVRFANSPNLQNHKVGTRQLRTIQNDLDQVSSDLTFVIGSTELTADTTSQADMYNTVFQVGRNWESTKYDQYRLGFNELNSVRSQIQTWFLRQVQSKVVKNIIDGAFATGGALNNSTHVATTGLADPDYLSDILQLFGEAKEGFRAFMMHSKDEQVLRNNGLIADYPATDLAMDTLRTGLVPTIHGKLVIVNDTICAEANGERPIYAVGNNFLTVERTENIEFFEDFNPKKGGGTDELYMYTSMTAYINGLSWAKSSGAASFAELATATNWEKPSTVNTKNIYVAKGSVSAVGGGV